MPSFNALRSDDPIIRRRALKNLSYSLTGRAIWRFMDTFLVRGGWLDGTAGFHYALMISMYEYWIELKIRELEQNWIGQTDDVVVGDAWSDYIPESAKLTADWTYPWVCGNCETPKYAAVVE